jgi:hypothetical protein
MPIQAGMTVTSLNEEIFSHMQKLTVNNQKLQKKQFDLILKNMPKFNEHDVSSFHIDY